MPGVIVDLHTRTMRRCDTKPEHMDQRLGDWWTNVGGLFSPKTLACDMDDTSAHTSQNMWRWADDGERVGVSIFVLRFGLWRHSMTIAWTPSDVLDTPTLVSHEE